MTTGTKILIDYARSHARHARTLALCLVSIEHLQRLGRHVEAEQEWRTGASLLVPYGYDDAGRPEVVYSDAAPAARVLRAEVL